jgi:CRP-like cAMP-binding protein
MFAATPHEVQRRFRAKLLEYLPEQLADELSSHHTTVTYAAGSILFLQGSPADLIFWVISGLVKISCAVREEDRIIVRIAGPGDVLGYAYVMGPNGEMSQAFEAQALTKCTVALVPREYLPKVLDRLDKGSIISLMERLNASWSALAQRFVIFLGLPFRERLELTLKDLASRFGVQEQRGILLGTRLSHAELAEMIDSSRPMVTRLIADMIADKSLYRIGKQYVLPTSTPWTRGVNQDRASFVKAVPLGNQTSQRTTAPPSPAKVRQIRASEYRA